MLAIFFSCQGNSNNGISHNKNINNNNSVQDSSDYNAEMELSKESKMKLLYTEVNILIGKGEYQGAIEKLHQIIKLDSIDGKFYYDIGYCLSNLNRDSLAINYYKESLKRNYDKFEVYRVLGITYFLKLNNYEKGLYYFKLCLELNPNDEEIKEFIREIEKRYTDKT
jgi:tetratricopeptide (TPR) repeat protein